MKRWTWILREEEGRGNWDRHGVFKGR
jgi:hypothetical protein